MRKDIIKIMFAIVMIIVIFFVAKYVSNLDTTSLEEHNFYQYFAGRKVEYKGRLEISRKNNGITSMQIDELEIELDSTPIYYGDMENKLLFPEDMAIIQLKDETVMQKVTHFSTLEIDNDIPYLQYEKNQEPVKNSFVFDGSNLYVFLEATTLIVEGQTYELSPLSYAIVTYRQTVEIYQKQEDVYQVINCESGNVKATTSECEINLSTDTITYRGKEQLLLKKIEILPSFNWEV